MRNSLVLAIVVGAVVAAAIGGAWALRLTLSGTNPEGPVRHWVAFSDANFEGNPQQNTSIIWVAIISDVGTEEPFSSYEAGLYQDGSVLVDPVALHTGLLGTSGDLEFGFFDYGWSCLPTPCPPPEGPDGLMNEQDYFRLSFVESGASYVIRVFWVETGELAGELTINT